MKKYLAIFALAFLFPISVFAGTQNYTTPGTYTFAVPQYTASLTVEVWGGGGGGGGGVSGTAAGGNGTVSSFNSVMSAGGGSGGSIRITGALPPLVIASRATGGTINISGNFQTLEQGGSAPFGGIGGGTNAPVGAGRPGGVPGGGGGGASFGYYGAGGGVSGAYAKRTYTPTTLVPGSLIPIVVGAGGRGAIHSLGNGGEGAPGMVKIVWIDVIAPPPPPTNPTCSITITPSTITAGQNSTLSYTATNALSMSINNGVNSVVIPSGTRSVSPLVTTTYTGIVTRTGSPNGTCSATLTVTPSACFDSCPTADGYVRQGNACVCPTGRVVNRLSGLCVSNNNTVSTPVVTAIGQCIVGQDQQYTISAATADGATLHYGFDWQGSGPITQWEPTVGYVPSGTVRTVTHTWATVGSHTFRALAEDSSTASRRSEWAVVNLSCQYAPCPTGQHRDTVTGLCVPDPLSCTPGFVCQGSNRCWRNAQCVIDNSSCIPCPYGCNAGACNPPPVPSNPRVVKWNVVPLLIGRGQSARVSWDVVNVASCTVRSTNGDGLLGIVAPWNLLSGTNIASRPINSQTIFTLHCIPLSGLSQSVWTDQRAVVNVAPNYIIF